MSAVDFFALWKSVLRFSVHFFGVLRFMSLGDCIPRKRNFILEDKLHGALPIYCTGSLNILQLHL